MPKCKIVLCSPVFLLVLLFSQSVWSCLLDPQWQDTMRCQFYPAQTPPPAPTAPAAVDQLADFTRVDLPFLNAAGNALRCVDGTRPIIYVDKAEVENSNHWLISLQGGGSCFDAQSCLDAYLNPAEQEEMGSALMPAMQNLSGINQPRAENTFRNFHRVKVHKCGYDRYNGTSVVNNVSAIADSDVNGNGIANESINGPFSVGYDPSAMSVLEGGVYTFGLAHQGRLHLLHAIDNLLGGLNFQTWVNKDGKVESVVDSLPPMSQAESVVFVGHSGAAHGLMHNIDGLVDYMSKWVQAQGGEFDTDVRAVFDAHLLPALENEVAFIDHLNLDMYDNFTTCMPPCVSAPPLHFNYDAQSYFSSGGIGGPGYFDAPHAQWGADLDSSCLAAHPQEQWRCADRFHVLFNHISTPFFIRQDFRDPNSQHNNNPAGAENGGHRLFWAIPEYRHCSDPNSADPCLPVLSEADFRARIEEQARRLRLDFATRSERAQNQLSIPTAFLWVPDCGSHKGAFDAKNFFNVSLKNDFLSQHPATQPQSEATMHDFLIKFLQSPAEGEFESLVDGDLAWRSVCEPRTP